VDLDSRLWHYVDVSCIVDISEILTVSTFKVKITIAARWLALQLHIQEVLDSNLSSKTSYHDSGFSCFFPVSSGN
jgi:hypothetical protein